MQNFLTVAMEQFELAASYKNRVLRLLKRVKNIRNDGGNLGLINTLCDEIVKEQKFIESQIKATHVVVETSAMDPHATARRIGWIEMRDLLDFAFRLVLSILPTYILPNSD